jgi:hypothetical protein
MRSRFLSLQHTVEEIQMGTIVETAPHAGDKEFVSAVRNNDAAPVKGVGTFKYKLSLNGAPIGWMGKGGSQSMWAMVVPEEKDAVVLQWYAYNGANYLDLKDFGYMTWSNGLSGQPVAFNTWPYANGWKEQGGLLVAIDSGAPVSLYRSDVAWLYANSSYSAVGVARVDV